MKKIYFVRHGQSEWNVLDKICGAVDVPLTEKGISQALETGKNIVESGIKIDKILYSPLERAKVTALKISEMTGVPASEEPRLMEQHFGKWEGHSPRSDVKFAEAKGNFLCRHGNGESMFQVAQRIYNLLDELSKDDKVYVLVAHNGIARVVKSYFEEMTNEEYVAFGVPNCKLIEYEFED